jgi:hypothetical protein
MGEIVLNPIHADVSMNSSDELDIERFKKLERLC